jgi:S1-C subfamily serine protease
MNGTNSPQRSTFSTLLAGVLGGLVVLVLGSVLIATDVIDTGDETTRVVRESVPTRGISNSSAEEAGGRTVSEIYKEEGRGVVFIQARGTAGSADSPFGVPDGQGTSAGSGFVIDKDGTIITNAHVVAGADDIGVRFEDEGDFVDAELLGQDIDSDVAVLKVDPDEAELKALPLGDSSSVEVGDPLIAIGNPFGAYTRTVTTGIVSALQRRIEAPSGFQIDNVIQTDAAINPGNSGGPLLDAEGRVVGINSQIATGGSQGSVGIGFAVPINTVKKLLPALERGEDIERAFLGIEMIGVTDELARDLNLESDEGALIQSIVEDGPADEAGLRAGRTTTGEGVVAGGDLIVEVDGEKVSAADDIPAAIADNKPGDTVEVVFYRGDDRKTVEVELGKRPSSARGQDRGGGLPELP